MDLISTVLGILSSGLYWIDLLRLTLDLNSVFIKVDFPRPLCPKKTKRKKITKSQIPVNFFSLSQRLKCFTKIEIYVYLAQRRLHHMDITLDLMYGV